MRDRATQLAFGGHGDPGKNAVPVLLDRLHPIRTLLWLSIAAAVTACVAATLSGGAAARTETASAQAAIVPIAASPTGRAVRVRVGIRGWRTGWRWRIYVDGRYNNFSTDPKLGLAVAVPPGRHRISVDLVAGRTRVARGTKTLTATAAFSGLTDIAVRGYRLSCNATTRVWQSVQLAEAEARFRGSTRGPLT